MKEPVTFHTTILQTGANTSGIQVPEQIVTQLDVTLALDLEPPFVELPPDLKAALIQAGVLIAFEKTAPSRQKEYVRQVLQAKAPETRERRINRIVENLLNS
jgi:hypothetical protein